MAQWAGVLLSGGAILFSLVSARSKASSDRLAKLEDRVSCAERDKAGADRLAAVETRMVAAEREIAGVKDDLEHLPNKESTHRLELSLSELKGEIGRISERMKPVAEISTRLQDFLLDQAGRK